jgi:hypothetical protein
MGRDDEKAWRGAEAILSVYFEVFLTVAICLFG